MEHKYEHHIIDQDAGYDGWGAVIAADLDGDGAAEFATGGKGGGFYYLYDLQKNGVWQRHTITKEFEPNVGAAFSDLDGDGRLEIVCGEWGEHLHWLTPPAQGLDGWSDHIVGGGLENPHDMLAADLTGNSRDEIISREKDGVLAIYHVPVDPNEPWERQLIAEMVEGDGSDTGDLTGNGALDIITSGGWFENVQGDGSEWVQHPVIDSSLNWHPETRLVYTTTLNNKPQVVITESEIGPARLAILTYVDADHPWKTEVLLGRHLDLRALHSLQLADLDEDGEIEIFYGEMENGKTDGIEAKPRWWLLDRNAEGTWEPHCILDKNMGTHCAAVADYGRGKLDIVGKLWRANPVNGLGGVNHVDWLKRLD